MIKGKIIKFLIFVSTASFLTTTYAVAPGFYLGLMTGPATNTASKQSAQVKLSTATVPAKPRSNQWGTRFFLGYKINQYAGAEFGLTYISAINFQTPSGIKTCGATDVRVRDFDAVAKGALPLGDTGFDVFGKAGVAIVYTTIPGALNPNPSINCGQNVNQVKFRPTIAIGASYDLSQNWVTDFSWTRIMAGNIVKNVDVYALGISYHFVDRYCGQFLCDD